MNDYVKGRGIGVQHDGMAAGRKMGVTVRKRGLGNDKHCL